MAKKKKKKVNDLATPNSNLVSLIDCALGTVSSTFLTQSHLVTKQGSSWGTHTPCPCHVLHLPLICRKTLAFPELQRMNLIRELRKYRKENSQARQNNNSLAIKQSQGPLVPPQGL